MSLGIIEVLDRDGSARRTVTIVSWPLTIGRALHCDVVLDDPHVAALHVTILEADGALSLTVGDSINGAEWKGTRLRAGGSSPLPSGEVFQLGATRLRIRRPGDVLAAERALAPEPAAGRIPLPLLIAALLMWVYSEQWLATDPGAHLTQYIGALLGIVLGLVAWCGLWALASKLFRHRFEFWPHTRIAVSYVLLSQVLAAALPVLAFMSGWTILSRIAGLGVGAVTSAMVVAHFARIVPTRKRALGYTMAGLFAAGVAVIFTMNYQTQDRFFSELYASTIAPPALRLASPVTPTQFLEEAKDLKAVLDAHAKDTDDGGEEGFLFSGVDSYPGSKDPGLHRASESGLHR